MMQNKLFKRKLVGTGYSLQGRLLQIALTEKLDIWIDTPVTELISENGRVTGVVARREGKDVRVEARDGVLINAGGFAHSAEMRKQWLEQPDSADWTVSNKGDTGEMLQMAMDLGAEVENMHMAWWVPGTFPPEGGTAIHVGEHARPHAIVVDSQGQRFVNEGTSYVEIGLAFYRHNRDVPCIPAWIIMDSRHRKHYSFYLAPPGKPPQAWLDSGFMKQADTLADLAGAMRPAGRRAASDDHAVQRLCPRGRGPRLRPGLFGLCPLHRRSQLEAQCGARHPGEAALLRRPALAARRRHLRRPRHRRTRPRARQGGQSHPGPLRDRQFHLVGQRPVLSGRRGQHRREPDFRLCRRKARRSIECLRQGLPTTPRLHRPSRRLHPPVATRRHASASARC